MCGSAPASRRHMGPLYKVRNHWIYSLPVFQVGMVAVYWLRSKSNRINRLNSDVYLIKYWSCKLKKRFILGRKQRIRCGKIERKNDKEYIVIIVLGCKNWSWRSKERNGAILSVHKNQRGRYRTLYEGKRRKNELKMKAFIRTTLWKYEPFRLDMYLHVRWATWPSEIIFISDGNKL